MNRWVAVATWSVCVVLLTGCAASRHAVVSTRLAAHVYPQRAEAVLAQARVLLREQGFAERPSDSTTSLSTHWKEQQVPGIGRSFQRLHVWTRDQGQGGVQVEILRTTLEARSEYNTTPNHVWEGPRKSPTRERTARDWALELELLRSIDPDAAARIETAAESH